MNPCAFTSFEIPVRELVIVAFKSLRMDFPKLNAKPVFEVVVESDAISMGWTSSRSLGNEPEQFVERL